MPNNDHFPQSWDLVKILKACILYIPLHQIFERRSTVRLCNNIRKNILAFLCKSTFFLSFLLSEVVLAIEEPSRTLEFHYLNYFHTLQTFTFLFKVVDFEESSSILRNLFTSSLNGSLHQPSKVATVLQLFTYHGFKRDIIRLTGFLLHP